MYKLNNVRIHFEIIIIYQSGRIIEYLLYNRRIVSDFRNKTTYIIQFVDVLQ